MKSKQDPRQVNTLIRFSIISAVIFCTIAVGILIIKQQTSQQLPWQQVTLSTQGEISDAAKPVLLVFTADWCQGCKTLNKRVYGQSSIVQAVEQADLIAYRFDMTYYDNDQQAFLEQYGGSVLPYAVILDKDGLIKQRFTGLFSVDTLLEAIRMI